MGCLSRTLEPGFTSSPQSGDALVYPANSTTVSVPEVTGDRWVKVSFSSMHGKVYVRVTIHHTGGRELTSILIDPDKARTAADQGIQLPAGTTKISVARMHHPGTLEDTPADVLIEYNGD
jgi:hypothetical protein